MTSSRTVTLTWWGCAGVEIESAGRRLVVDPYLNPTEPRINYICITHNDYDHCHDETLEKLAVGPQFERMIVPPSAPVKSSLDSPLHGKSTDLAFVPPEKLTIMYPKYTREPAKRHPGPTELTLDGFRIETVDSSERPERYKPNPTDVWPVGSGPFVGDATYPNNGYVITALDSGLTFYHPGDLGDVFDAHRELRGRIDVMLFPTIKLQGMEVSMIDAIRPKQVIPMHYRLPTPEFPVPLHVSQSDLKVANVATAQPVPGADPHLYRTDIHTLMEGHWYPTPPDPALDRFERITPDLEALGSQVTIVEAGRPYVLSGAVTASV